jgi:hypothetical protein
LPFSCSFGATDSNWFGAATLAMGERIIDCHIDARAWIFASTGSQRAWDNVSEMMRQRPEH